MKVLFHHMFDLGKGWGGSASMLLALHASLKDQGHLLDVVSLRYPEPYGITTCGLPFDFVPTFGPEKRPGEITIDELDSRDIQRLTASAAETVERELFRYGLPDLMIANHINLMALVCWHLHRKFRVPYRIISYGTDTQLLLRDQRYRELFGEAAREAERILAISAFTARQVRETVGGAVEVLGGAIDPRLFSRPEVRVSLPGRLVYFGRLVTEKGILVLLEALARQKAATELLIVGEGPLRSAIEHHVQQASMNCKVTLLGHFPQAQLREILTHSAAVVVPSIWEEPLGLVVLEAFACGIPVIASAVGGIPEMIQEGKNGLLVPAGDSAALASAIDRLLGDEARYGRMVDFIAGMDLPTYADLARQVIR